MNIAFTKFSKTDINQSIPSRFEHIARCYPLHIAIKTNEESLTYCDLNIRANQIARTLLSASDRANSSVAVLIDSNSDTIAALLGVLKTGNFYIPIDPFFSRDWVAYILENTDTKLILTGKDNYTRAKAWLKPSQTLIDLDSIDRSLAAENLDLHIPPLALAHVLYTSGSTGSPKGVMENHRNVLHYVMRLTNVSHISPNDRITLLRPPRSCGALSNLYIGLLNGSSIFAIDIKQIGFSALADWLIKEKITIFHSSGPIFRDFAQQLAGQESFPDLRLIRLSSGAIFRTEVELFKRHFPDSILFHVLSSTEANTYRALLIDKDSELPVGALPVGYPVEDMEILILDESGNVIGANTVGEIAVRSKYLFPGYWKNADLTESVLLSDPGSRDHRIFRTGDLGRLDFDNCLEFIGRKDFRLKIRGHSIQSEEVERALLKIPGIKQAAVASFLDDHGDSRLAAYVVPSETSVPTVDQLREILKTRLPEYVVPTSFIVLKALPLNASGKVDRRMLPPPPRTRPNLSTGFIEPSSLTEVVMAKAWSEALCIDSIGAQDNFFDLGGDLLLASRISAKINKLFSVNLTPTTIYEAPTVAVISDLLKRQIENWSEFEKNAQAFLGASMTAISNPHKT